MDTIILGILAAAIALGLLGMHWKAGFRSIARVALGILFGSSLLATLALIVGSIALGSKGAGVLFLAALPAAVVAWVAGSLFFAVGRGARYFALDVDEKIEHNLTNLEQTLADLRASIAAKTAERERFWTSARRREQLAREIWHAREQLEKLPQLRDALARPEAYAKDEP
ncbi:MAG: hypothetical protein IT386_10125 [Deltaproteobacteria bacterium]|nr:hypothetical protein [Deltaproteobacteria bacterium]